MTARSSDSIPGALAALAAEVCAAARRLIPDGLAVGTAGNLSARDLASGLIAVTPAGFAYEAMTPADITIVDPDGLVVRGERRPTSELALHTMVYAQHRDVGAIVHTHSPYATAFSVAHHPVPLVCNEGLLVGTVRVEVADFGMPGTPGLGQAALRLLDRYPSARAFLLANHGVVALDSTVVGAYALAGQVEWEARIYHLALAVGEPHVLTRPQMDEIRRHYADLPPVGRSSWGIDP